MKLGLNQKKTGATLSYVNIAVNTLIGLFFTPFIIRSLGPSEYGLYSLIGATVVYLALFDLGLGNALIRYVAKYDKEGDGKGKSNFIAICLVLYGGIAMIAIIAGLLINRNLAGIFPSLSAQELSTAQTMFVLLIFNIVITMFNNAFTGIMSGHGIFVYSRVLAIARNLLRVAVLIALLSLGFKSVSIVVTDTVLNVLMLLIGIRYVFTRMKVKVRLCKFDLPLIKEIFSFSFFIFLNMIADLIFWKAGQVILGSRKGTVITGSYENVMILKNMYMALSTAISGVFLPTIMEMEIRKASGKEFTDVLIKTGRLQFSLIGILLVGFFTIGQPFILLWIGPEYSVVYPITLLFMFVCTVPLIQNVGISILEAKKLHWFRGVCYSATSALCVIICVLTVDTFGIWGIASATAASMFLGHWLSMNLFYRFAVKINIWRFFKEVSRGILPSLLLALVAGWLATQLPQLNGRLLLELLVPGVILTVLYIACMLLFGLNKDEKKICRSVVNKAVKVFPLKRKR